MRSLKTDIRSVAISLLFFLSAALFVLMNASDTHGWEGDGPLIIEHTCTDFSRIPLMWIDSTKVKMRMYYGHTSHGEQVTEGLRRIEAASPYFAYEMAHRALPDDPNTFCVNDDRSVSPETYWLTAAGMNRTRDALTSYPAINMSMFMWCDQLMTWSQAQVEEYFDSIESLEAEFPGVTFVYATGHAQGSGAIGYNRYLRNEQIRAYCEANDKVLFDFGDMDAWWYNPATQEWEQNTYIYGEVTVPIQHSTYDGDEWAHTTFESCEVKGRGMWWLATMLSGWYADSSGKEETTLGGLKKRFQRR
jgi:hypothetical protein